MDYIEVKIDGQSGADFDILTAQLGEIGFESFSESESGMNAYIPESLYVEPVVLEYLEDAVQRYDIRFQISRIVQQNWNQLWESAYDSVNINDLCRIRAPFHTPDPTILFDIVIEPKMSFGTAHHPTTFLMLDMLLAEEISGRRVLDMGCGTGILAILAAKKNAQSVVAIDTDEWAFENTMENVERNDVRSIEVIRGDVACIPPPAYDLIIANINRNVLLADIPYYSSMLNTGGGLLMSGFYTEDLPMITEMAVSSGLTFVHHHSKENWVGAKFMK